MRRLTMASRVRPVRGHMVKERAAEGSGCGGASVCGGVEGWLGVVSVSDIVTTKRGIWDFVSVWF